MRIARRCLHGRMYRKAGYIVGRVFGLLVVLLMAAIVAVVWQPPLIAQISEAGWYKGIMKVKSWKPA